MWRYHDRGNWESLWRTAGIVKREGPEAEVGGQGTDSSTSVFAAAPPDFDMKPLLNQFADLNQQLSSR